MEKREVAIRTYQPGDAGYIAQQHVFFYQKVYGFKPIFEYYVLKGLTDFLGDPTGGQVWIATVNGQAAGSIAIVRAEDGVAQLRWFLVEEKAQGLGLGNQLISTAINFCREQGYHQVYLWTVDFLPSARHLYEKHGFTITETKENDEWTNHTITEERWDLPI